MNVVNPKAFPPPKGMTSKKEVAYPIMCAILHRHPNIPLAQLGRQLANHGIYVKERTAQTWMHRIIVAIRLQNNRPPVNLICDGSASYAADIFKFVQENGRTSGPDIIYLAYYKLGVSFQDFGAPQGQNGKGDTGPFISTLKEIFIMASKNGIRQYDTSEDAASGYSYWASLERLIADSAASGRGSFAISSHMEGQKVVLEKLLDANHSAFVFPENHSDLHLGDVLFFNMGSQLQKRHPKPYRGL